MSHGRSTTILLLLFGCLIALLAPAATRAASPIVHAEVTPSTTQAGGHPDLRTVAVMTNSLTQILPKPNCGCQDPKNLAIHLPAGVIGDPHATPQCSPTDFAFDRCPPDSQVGTNGLGVGDELNWEEPHAEQIVAVYNLVPHPGEAGLLGFHLPIFHTPLFIVLEARTEGDYGLDAEAINIEQFIPLSFISMNLWGVPASPVHTPDRVSRGCEPFFKSPPCSPTPSTSTERPFLSNPTTCGVPLSASVDVLAYDNESTHADVPYPGTTGCDQLGFNPSMFVQPTTTAADSPSGLDVDLVVPQPSSPTVPSPSEIRSNVLTLPEGLTLNANAADGKVACTDAEARFGTREEAQCPENSKVGTVSLTSTVLPAPIHGYAYIREPKPGQKFGLVLTADGYNTHVKLPARVDLDPQTGRVQVITEELPQSPFSDFDLHLFGSERGIMATPTHCGTLSAAAHFTPWDSLLPDQSSSQFFSVASGPEGSACPPALRPFAPEFEAGVSDNTAGTHSPVQVQIVRQDGDQELRGVTVALPPGFSASLAGVPYCPEAALAAVPGRTALEEASDPSCPAASRVGTVDAGLGAGSRPFHVPGGVYLAGPYKGAPLSLAAIVPALSGPYDLGNVLVRVALFVNPLDAHVTAVSDPLPRIIEGVVLRTRSILLQLDRPGFALNPTDCDPLEIRSALTGDQGATADSSQHFQVANCADLPYSPKLSIRLSGGLNRLGHPAVHAVLRSAPGEANSRSVQVTLPPGELLDNSHIGTVCTKVAFAANSCPSGSKVGRAEVTTPLLDQPLSGSVYLRASSRGLPDLALDLEGQFHIEAVGHIDSVNQRYRATFSTVPDVPVSTIVLDLAGGAKGLLQNSESLCTRPRRAMVQMVGQNGARVSASPRLQIACRSARHRRPASR